MERRELVALLNWSFWCLVMVEWLFLAVPWVCLRFVIVVFPDHSQLLYIIIRNIFTMMDLRRMPKNIMEHSYCVTEHISMKICRLLPLFVKK